MALKIHIVTDMTTEKKRGPSATTREHPDI